MKLKCDKAPQPPLNYIYVGRQFFDPAYKFIKLFIYASRRVKFRFKTNLVFVEPSIGLR